MTTNTSPDGADLREITVAKPVPTYREVGLRFTSRFYSGATIAARSLGMTIEEYLAMCSVYFESRSEVGDADA